MRFCSRAAETEVRIPSAILKMKFIFSARLGPAAQKWNTIRILEDLLAGHTGMSSVAEIGAVRSPRTSISRILFWLVVAVLMVGAGVVGDACHVAHSAMQQLDGQFEMTRFGASV